MWLRIVSVLVFLTPIGAVASGGVENILKAAADIGAIQKKSGAAAANAMIKQCYQRELPAAKSLTPELEACMTQDMLISMLTISVHQSVGPEALKRNGLPIPDEVHRSLTQRWLAIGKQVDLSVADQREFARVVNTKGLEEFRKALMAK